MMVWPAGQRQIERATPSNGRGEHIGMGFEPEAVSPSQRGHGAQHERRSGEAMQNANALRLGIAAQMLASRLSETSSAHHSGGMPGGLPLALPLPPMARMSARYASVAEGQAQPASMGFSRQI
jgi:hypothetical protein